MGSARSSACAAVGHEEADRNLHGQRTPPSTSGSGARPCCRWRPAPKRRGCPCPPWLPSRSLWRSSDCVGSLPFAQLCGLYTLRRGLDHGLHRRPDADRDARPAGALRASHGDALRKPANTNHPSGLERFFPPPRPSRWPWRWRCSCSPQSVIGWPWLSGRVTIPWDAKAHFQPQIQFLAQSLARGQSPFWAPFVFSGHPQIADPQAMIFSPPFLALALIDGAPSLWAVDATVLAMVALGGAGPDAVVPRSGLALGRRADRGAGLQLRGVDGLAHPAHRPGAEPRLSADRPASASTARWRAARSSTASRAGVVAAVIVLGRDQVALLAIYLLAAFGALAHLVARSGRAPPCARACCRSAPARSARWRSSPCPCC